MEDIEYNCNKTNCIYYKKIFYNKYCRFKKRKDYEECLKSEDFCHYHDRTDFDPTLFTICLCDEVVFFSQDFCYECLRVNKQTKTVKCDCGTNFHMLGPRVGIEVWENRRETIELFFDKNNKCPKCGTDGNVYKYR